MIKMPNKFRNVTLIVYLFLYSCSVAHLLKKLLTAQTTNPILCSSLTPQMPTFHLSIYFIVIEQAVFIECKTMTNAIFTLFAVHYVFNLEYNVSVKKFLGLYKST